MFHRNTKVFGRGAVSRIFLRDLVTCAVVFDHERMFHRKVGCLLIELAGDRITSGLHCFTDKPIRIRERRSRIIYKFFLSATPLSGELFALRFG